MAPLGVSTTPASSSFSPAVLGLRPIASMTCDASITLPSLSAAERSLLPAMLRAGALRFWLSRLWDWHLPREAAMLKPHDPTHFEHVLRERVRQSRELSVALVEDGGVTA